MIVGYPRKLEQVVEYDSRMRVVLDIHPLGGTFQVDTVELEKDEDFLRWIRTKDWRRFALATWYLASRGHELRLRRMGGGLWIDPRRLNAVPHIPKSMLLAPDDVLLDMGAHIGTFTDWAAKSGCRVVAVEPIPWLHDNWRVNCSGLPNCSAVRGAVVPDSYDSPFVDLRFKPDGTSMGASYVRTKGKGGCCTVPAVRIRDLLDGSFTALKVDVEGAEYGLDLPSHLDGVRKLCVDFHVVPDFDWRGAIAQHIEAFAGLGFRMVKDPSPPKFNSDYCGEWTR